MKKDIIVPFDSYYNVKPNDKISFYTSCNADRCILTGTVSFDNNLGFIVKHRSTTFELRKLIDVKIIQGTNIRTAYQFHHLKGDAKKRAENENKGTLLTQWLYNYDGSLFETSTTVHM